MFQLVTGGTTMKSNSSKSERKYDDSTNSFKRNQTAADYQTYISHSPIIIVATPGRLDDMLQRFTINLKELDTLVLDEADRLLDLGFADQIGRIVAKCPKQRRTGLFSATMTDAVEELIRMGLRNPVRVVVKIEQRGNSSNEQNQRTPTTFFHDFLISNEC